MAAPLGVDDQVPHSPRDTGQQQAPGIQAERHRDERKAEADDEEAARPARHAQQAEQHEHKAREVEKDEERENLRLNEGAAPTLPGRGRSI
jgi:hypothetical protein